KPFQPAKRTDKQICEEFLERNHGIIGENRDRFRYKEKAFLAGYSTAPLATGLVPDICKHLSQWNQIQKDQQYIKQVLINLLKPCMKKYEIRDALPECLVSFFPELRSIVRPREHGWTLKDKPILYEQYQHALSKIEMYYA